MAESAFPKMLGIEVGGRAIWPSLRNGSRRIRMGDGRVALYSPAALASAFMLAMMGGGPPNRIVILPARNST